MAIYICNECDGMIDADTHGCNECPTNQEECVCDNCLMEMDDE